MDRYVITRDEFKCDYPVCFWDTELNDKLVLTDGAWSLTIDGHLAEMDMSYPDFQKHYGGLHLAPGDKRVMLEQYSWEDEDEDGDFDTHGVRWYLDSGGDICCK